MTEKITNAVLTGNLYDIAEILQEHLEAGQTPMACLEAMIAGLDETGKRFDAGDYFVPELMMAGDVFKTGMKTLEPHLAGTERDYAGVIVLGTVEGDVHDIGKNLVGFMLESAGFKVIDLGVNVSTGQFLDAVKEHSADILGMSALLTTTMLGMEEVVKALEGEGLREKVKIIIGGAPVSALYAEQIGADAFAFDAVEGVQRAKELIRS